MTSDFRKDLKLFATKKQDNKDPMESWNDFKTNLDSKVNEYSMGKTTPEDTQQIYTKALEIIDRMAISNKINFDHAAIGVCALFQCGAHIKGVTNRTITVQNYDFTKENLLYASTLSKNTYPLRSIARSLRDEILKVSRYYKIPGHLFRKFKLENPEFIYKDEEHMLQIMISCSDFQTENPNIPIEAKVFLSKRDISRKERKKK